MNYTLDTYKISIRGIVQGVGFRPFILLLFKNNNIYGTVTNTTEGVCIEANFSDEKEVRKISAQILMNQPEPALIESIEFKKVNKKEFTDFKIIESLRVKEKFQLISPDIATCDKCKKEITDKNNTRRFFYAFTNCTNCGPRFTIIKKMPYDRMNTTMSRFKMCEDCENEYKNPADRRFHAQPNACIKCGPGLTLLDSGGKIVDKENPVGTAVDLLKRGKIIAIKSLGGFQIACSAVTDSAVKKLRKRKFRPFKPFAVMFKNISSVRLYLKAGRIESKLLKSSRAPIVLLKKHNKNGLSFYVSFGNKYEGAILPYTPIHHLIFQLTEIPLIMTSGNISEEPIASDNKEALERLKDICDYFLVHNRDIYSKYDDSVIKVTDGKEMLIRRARGYAPYPIKLDLDIKNRVILAAGAQEKNTFCILTKNYAIVSQHMGDLESKETMDFYTKSLNIYKELFGFKKFDAVAYDMHPDYLSTEFSISNFLNSKKIPVQHHIAHTASVIAENNLLKTPENFLSFSWDGTGYGTDGKIWGGEIFLVKPELNFYRIGHLKEKILPGGDISIKNPYRMAVVYLYEYFKNIKNIKDNKLEYSNVCDDEFKDFIFKNFEYYKKYLSSRELEILLFQVRTEYNSPITTSMGRLFDAVSSILNITQKTTYEGEAAVDLEMNIDEKIKSFYKIKINHKKSDAEDTERKFSINELFTEKQTFEVDDFYIVNQVILDCLNGLNASAIAAKFHNTISALILNICLYFKNLYNIDSIILTGGVFQNNFLVSKVTDTLKKSNFNIYSNFKVPVNDGGISLGQAYIAAASMKY